MSSAGEAKGGLNNEMENDRNETFGNGGVNLNVNVNGRPLSCLIQAGVNLKT